MNLALQALTLSPDLKRRTPFTYILRLQSGGLYVGCSSDFETRLRDHETGAACRTTRFDPPVFVAWIEIQPDFPSARQREAQIKKWSRSKKEALIEDDSQALRSLSESRAESPRQNRWD